MKVLFVCRGNVARSQMAAAIYNRLTRSHDADSAGTQVLVHGETLAQRRIRQNGKSPTLDVMHDAGYDLDDNKQTLLTPDMLTEYDLVVSMAGKRYTPQWLAQAHHYTYWKITDPTGRSYAITQTTKDKVEAKVRELITQQNKQTKS